MMAALSNSMVVSLTPLSDCSPNISLFRLSAIGTLGKHEQNIGPEQIDSVTVVKTAKCKTLQLYRQN